MKESAATSTIFRLVLAFTLLFAGFLSVAIVYNRAYRLKNESLAIIEKYEGINKNNKKTIQLLNNYLKNSGYNTTGDCVTGEEYGIKNLDSNDYEVAKRGTKYYYCLDYYCSSSCKIKDSLNNKTNNEIFYKFKLFFKFNLPFIGELTTFKITGDTKGINLYSENQKL